MKAPRWLLDVGNMDDEVFFEYLKSLSQSVENYRKRLEISRELRMLNDPTGEDIGRLFSQYDEDELEIINQFIYRIKKEKKKLVEEFLEDHNANSNDERCYKIAVYSNALTALGKRRNEIEEERRKNK